MTGKVANCRFFNPNNDNSTSYNIYKVEDDLGRTEVSNRFPEISFQIFGTFTFSPYLCRQIKKTTTVWQTRRIWIQGS